MVYQQQSGYENVKGKDKRAKYYERYTRGDVDERGNKSHHEAMEIRPETWDLREQHRACSPIAKRETGLSKQVVSSRRGKTTVWDSVDDILVFLFL